MEVCDICGVNLLPGKTCADLYNELAFYTLQKGDADFIHQHIVDAYGAQHITKDSKRIQVGATLLGLYWSVEKGFSGREVQLEHMRMGKDMEGLKITKIPKGKATVTVADVLAVPAGSERDAMIMRWVEAIWSWWKEEHLTVKNFYEGASKRGI